jgi:hypothetical protein
MRTIYPSSCNKPEVKKKISKLHEDYYLVPAYKACNNPVFVYKPHYYQYIVNKPGINSKIQR